MVCLPRSPLGRDVLLGLAIVVVAELELALLDPSEIEGDPVGLHVAIVLLLPATGLRRTSPLGSIATAALGFAVLSAGTEAPVAAPFLALLFLLGSLGWFASTKAGALGVLLTVVAGMGWDLASRDVGFADVIVNIVLVTLAWAGSHLLRRATDRRIRAEVQADRAARQATRAERERISRDLHDSLGHALTLITLQAGGARERTEASLARTTLEAIERTGREALGDLRRFLDLLGTSGEEAPGLAHLPDLVDGVRRGGVEVDLALRADGVPASIQTTLYRVVQEGLTNAIRHSCPTRVRVSVERESRGVVARVSSDGQARDRGDDRGGRGLQGLRERLDLYGGELASGPTPTGWQLEARIPLGDA